MNDGALWYDYSYLPCQFCVGKNHCAQCGEEIRRALMEVDGVVEVRLDVPARRLGLVLDGVDAEDVVDRADALGVFL